MTLIMSIESNENRDKATEIYSLYYGTMLYIARKVLLDSALAEDAVAEAFIRIIKNIDKIETVDCYQTRGFVVIIVRNIAIDMLRKHKRLQESPFEESVLFSDYSDSVLDYVSSKEACQKIADCMSKLHESYSDILYLKIKLGCSNEEIAKTLGISRDNVKVRLSRARRALDTLLAKEDDLNAQ